MYRIRSLKSNKISPDNIKTKAIMHIISILVPLLRTIRVIYFVIMLNKDGH